MELNQREINGFQPIKREEYIEVSLEAIVPDTMSDVLKTAGAYGHVSLKDKNVQADRLIVGGTTEVQVLCVTENNSQGELMSVTLPVSHIITAPGCSIESVAHVFASVNQCSAEIINSRKLRINAKLKINSNIYTPNTIKISNGMSPVNGLQTLKKPYKNTCITAATEKSIRIVETIPLTTGGMKIIRYETEFVTEDMKVLKGKVMVRGNCQVRALFLHCANGEMVREKYHLPFTCVMENDCIGETDMVKLDYQCKWAQVEIRENGSDCGMVCDICADIALTGVTVVEEQVLVDAFHCTYDTHIKTAQTPFMQINGNESVKQELSNIWENVIDGGKIIDFSHNSSSNYSENGALNADVALNVTYRDNQGDVNNRQLTCNVVGQGKNGIVSADFKLENPVVSCTENGNMKLEANGIWDVTYGNTGSVNQIVDCKILEENVKAKKNNATLILRNIAENDSIWDVAKRYSTSPEAIFAANKLEPNQIVAPGTLIMIPIVK